MRAEPASHGFGMTKTPGASCSARKRAALSLWVAMASSCGAPRQPGWARSAFVNGIENVASAGSGGTVASHAA
jgi:hypothetical protein